MTKDEIKRSVSMTDVLARYGMTTNRAGFCRCPFHQGDNTPSMKIYKDGFNCFACGANGDVIDFVARMERVGFKEAFLLLGGTLPRVDAKNSFSVKLERDRWERELRKQKEEELERNQEKTKLQEELHMLLAIIKKYEPSNMDGDFPDIWCYAKDRFETVFYQIQHLNAGGSPAWKR